VAGSLVSGAPAVQAGEKNGALAEELCKDGRWRQWGIFRNQGDCVSYVVRFGPPLIVG
jgi:hypothetical protein